MPPQDIIGLTPEQFQLFRLLCQDYQQRSRRQPIRSAPVTGPNVQLVKVTSLTPDTTLGYERYPGVWIEKDPTTGTLTAMDTCWVTFPNGQTPDLGYMYAAHSQGSDGNLGIFWVTESPSGSDLSKTYSYAEGIATSTVIFFADGLKDISSADSSITVPGSDNLPYLAIVKWHLAVDISGGDTAGLLGFSGYFNVTGAVQTGIAEVAWTLVPGDGIREFEATQLYLLMLPPGISSFHLTAQLAGDVSAAGVTIMGSSGHLTHYVVVPIAAYTSSPGFMLDEGGFPILDEHGNPIRLE